MFYNDQPPNQPYTEKDGHTKGIVAGNSEGGFWLVHSLPKFPLVNVTTYGYPKSGTMYGQSFLCISMEQQVLDSVGNYLKNESIAGHFSFSNSQKICNFRKSAYYQLRPCF